MTTWKGIHGANGNRTQVCRFPGRRLTTRPTRRQGWLLACLTSQTQAGVSQKRICSDKFTCCHTETEAAGHTIHLTQSQYTDTGSTSPSADLITPGAWQGSPWSANVLVTGMTRPGKIPTAKAGIEPRIFHSRGRRLTTRPRKR